MYSEQRVLLTHDMFVVSCCSCHGAVTLAIRDLQQKKTVDSFNFSFSQYNTEAQLKMCPNTKMWKTAIQN